MSVLIGLENNNNNNNFETSFYRYSFRIELDKAQLNTMYIQYKH